MDSRKIDKVTKIESEVQKETKRYKRRIATDEGQMKAFAVSADVSQPPPENPLHLEEPDDLLSAEHVSQVKNLFTEKIELIKQIEHLRNIKSGLQELNTKLSKKLGQGLIYTQFKKSEQSLPIKQIIENLASSFNKMITERYDSEESLRDFCGRIKGIDDYLNAEIERRMARSHAIGVFLGVDLPWKNLKEVDDAYLHTDGDQEIIKQLLKDIKRKIRHLL